MEEAAARARVETWLMNAVIGLGLCPFAAPVVRQQQVRIVVRREPGADAILGVMIDELLALVAEAATHRTTLVVTPQALLDFAHFLEMVGHVDHMIDQVGLRGRIQLAHFHPDYVFAGVPADDRGNWTNRAPYPILHLLREDDVAAAVAQYPDAEGIPARNIARLQGMTLKELQHCMLIRGAAKDSGGPA